MLESDDHRSKSNEQSASSSDGQREPLPSLPTDWPSIKFEEKRDAVLTMMRSDSYEEMISAPFLDMAAMGLFSDRSSEALETLEHFRKATASLPQSHEFHQRSLFDRDITLAYGALLLDLDPDLDQQDAGFILICSAATHHMNGRFPLNNNTHFKILLGICDKIGSSTQDGTKQYKVMSKLSDATSHIGQSIDPVLKRQIERVAITFSKKSELEQQALLHTWRMVSASIELIDENPLSYLEDLILLATVYKRLERNDELSLEAQKIESFVAALDEETLSSLEFSKMMPKLGELYLCTGDTTALLELCKKVDQHPLATPDIKIAVHHLNCQHLNEAGDLNQALTAAKTLAHLPLGTIAPPTRSSILLTITGCYAAVGEQWQEVRDFAEQTIEVAEKYLGTTHFDQLQILHDALTYRLEASIMLDPPQSVIRIGKETIEKYGYAPAYVLLGIASAYFKLEQFSDAKEYTEQALELANKSPKPPYRLIQSLICSVDIACHVAYYQEKALEDYYLARVDRATQLARDLMEEDPLNFARSFSEIGVIWLNIAALENEDSTAYFQKAMSFMKESLITFEGLSGDVNPSRITLLREMIGAGEMYPFLLAEDEIEMYREKLNRLEELQEL